MAAQWEKWLRYARAKLDESVKRGNDELDRREAELEARRSGRTWLDSDRDAPSFDEARARIEERSGSSAGGSEEQAAIDLAAQERAAEERLAAIRDELGLDPTSDD